MNNLQEWERFVSLYGFFAFQFPKTWHQETDPSGHYILSSPNGGSGVIRIMVLDNQFEGLDAANQLMNEVFIQNKAYNPELLIVGSNKFVFYVKEHQVNASPFTVYYWATAFRDKAVLFTYTIQASMKDMAGPLDEKGLVEQMVASLEILTEKGSE